MYRYVLLFVLLIPSCAFADDWGKTGHRAVGEIAENYLDRKVKKKINELLNGHSLAFVSNYGDEIKSDRKYDSFGPWHYVNFPFGDQYDTQTKNKRGDIIMGIETSIQYLKDENSSKKDKVFYLKMLVHLMGDLHQPLHIGLEEDKGGNDFQVRWFGKGTNLHVVWDSSMLDYYGMSYTEVAANRNKLSKAEVETIKQGSVLDWAYDSRILCEDIYENTKTGEKLGYGYAYRYMDTVRHQIHKGGIRLAVLLNDIFG